MPDYPLPKVLVVNDDASTLLALSSVLTPLPGGPEYEVFMVQSGEEALREVLKHDFAVILLDVSMPGMDGFETADAIHSHPRSASVPIIFITAYRGDEFNRLKGYQKGAADYLFAPIIPQVVQAKVAVFVELDLKNMELERKTAALQAINGDLRVQRLLDLERVNAALQAEVLERRLAEHRATELATRDSLTGLFNRHLLLERLKDAIGQQQEQPENLALILLTVNKFRDINNNYGHSTGDELLRNIAQQLKEAAGENQLTARIGSDEFMIFLRGFSDTQAVTDFAKSLGIALNQSWNINGHSVKASTAIGISFYPQDGSTAEALLKSADAAASRAKLEPGSYQVFRQTPKATQEIVR